MRIGIEASNIRAGGGIVHLQEILNGWINDLQITDKIVIWGGRQTLSQLPDCDSIEKIYVKAIDKNLIARVLWLLFRFSKDAKNRCDILFIPGGIYTGSFRPFIVMSQNLLPFDLKIRKFYAGSLNYLKFVILKAVQLYTFKRADGIIFLTNFARQFITNRFHFGNKNFVIIPHGVNHSDFNENISTPSSNEFRVLYVSSITAYKNQRNLIKAIKELRIDGCKIKLDLIGRYSGRELKELKKEGIDFHLDNINFLGEIDHKSIFKYYMRADAYIIPSYCEAFGMNLLEAMAANLPIACSNRSAMSTILKDAGVYFDPGSVDAIKMALLKLMKDGNEMRASGKALTEAKKYSWEITAKKTYEYLCNVYTHYKDKQIT